ncbi:MAG: ferrochelatase [Proteobacteria bacterium]|nr:ferrochelatase [Pseudomonadota bacterium]
MKKTAVVLLNLGGPSSLEEVSPFLFSLFYDPAIITLPNPFRYLLAKFISRRRLKEAREIYSLLGGGSPLLKNTIEQAVSLENELGNGFRVFVSMRHAPPLVKDTLKDIKTYQPDEIVLLPLYPQYSTTTTGSALKVWEETLKNENASVWSIHSYPCEFGFLEAMTEKTLIQYKKAQEFGKPLVLFTAHGLPKRLIKAGDPYQRQVEETIQNLVANLNLPFLDYVICYQSRVGPLEWIGPSTEEMVISASCEKRPLVVVPVSFVSEHSETLVELDMTYRDLALRKGCPSYQRVETVQTHPFFIKGLARLVRENKGKNCVF